MNARLRSILLTVSIIAAGFTAVTYTACTEDQCQAIVCANGSVCQLGTCICPSGYEGPQCETINRERFIGIYVVNEDGSVSAPAQYTTTIENGDGITQIILKNFRNFYSQNVVARVKGDTLYIDPQTFNGNTIQGNGFIADDKFYGKNGKLTVRYQVQTASGFLDNYGLAVGSDNPSIWNK